MQLAENGPSVFQECIDSLKFSVKKKTMQSVNSIDELNNLLSSMRNKKKDGE